MHTGTPSACGLDLIPVTMKMHAANSEGIKILGAIIARFSAKAVSGETFTIRQITYITDGANKLFLSREACVALGMISNNSLVLEKLCMKYPIHFVRTLSMAPMTAMKQWPQIRPDSP